MVPNLLFFQLFESESSTYTYLIADPETKEAALIDPVKEKIDRDLALVQESGVKLVYVLDTHVHADHITAAGVIRDRTGAKTGLSIGSGVDCADLNLCDGQKLPLGKKTIQVLQTPGHTDSCLSYYIEGRLFTGDCLMIRGCGRTDFQQGSSEKLFASVREKLFSFPDETLVYPAHDYNGQTVSTIGIEKKFNPRLQLSKTKEEFIKIMSELKLADPKKIKEAVPANMACGQTQKA